LDSTPKQKRSTNSERRANRLCRSTDALLDRPAPTKSSHHTVGQPGGRPLFCHSQSCGRPFLCCACRARRSTGRSIDLVHRSTGRSTGTYLSLLHASFLFSLTSGLCAIFLYLLCLVSPYNSSLDEDFSNLSRTPTNSNISPGEIDTRPRLESSERN